MLEGDEVAVSALTRPSHPPLWRFLFLHRGERGWRPSIRSRKCGSLMFCAWRFSCRDRLYPVCAHVPLSSAPIVVRGLMSAKKRG